MMVKLGDIASIITKGTTPTTVGYNFIETGINFIKIESIDDNGNFIEEKFAHISEKCNDKLKRSQLKENDILFSIAGAIGRTAIVSKNILPANTNQALSIIRFDSTTVDYSFIRYALQSPKVFKQFEKQKQGVAQINLSLKNVSDLLIPNLDINQQRKIAETLDKVSDLIAKRKQQLEKLDLLVKSKFVEMFGDSKINSKKWLIKKLQDISDVCSSKRVFVDELQNSGIPFYRGTEIGALAENEKIKPELFITQEHYNALCEMSGFPQKGDLLMPSICPDGRIWLVNTDEPFYFKDGRVLWVHSTNKEINAYYLKYILKEKFMMDYNNIASGTTFAELKIFALKNLEIMLPPIELQNQFAHFVKKTEKTKTIINQSLEKLETLKKALMQEYFGG